MCVTHTGLWRNSYQCNFLRIPKKWRNSYQCNRVLGGVTHTTSYIPLPIALISYSLMLTVWNKGKGLAQQLTTCREVIKMTKKKTKEAVYQEIVTENLINDHSSSARMGIAQLYKNVTFNNGETTEVTGLDSHVLAKAIKKQEELLKAGDLTSLENMLLSQSHTLNAIFTMMVTNMGDAKYLANLETYGRIALKAQNQTRQTASTLAEIKGIKKETFIHQLNQANNQQVNNRAGENLNNSANERVLGNVDTRSETSSTGENQQNETLALPENTEGQEAISHECNKARNEVSKVAGVRKTNSHAGEARKRSKKAG